MRYFLQRYLNFFWCIFLISSSLSFSSSAFSGSLPESTTKIWLRQNIRWSMDKIADSISRADTLPGAVIAAKTKNNPNYYYHWVRDAGIVIDSMIAAYPSASPSYRDLISNKIFEYLAFSKHLQSIHTLSGLGEPKFNVDGTAFNEPWARPQNDGPALRAISLIHWANILLDEGQDYVVLREMYNRELPATSPIKMDLEYLSHHWRDGSYDLWEEVKGTHFYTLMVQRRALLEGAALAHKLDDEGASRWYFQQARAIEVELEKFWDPKRGYFVATINRIEGLDYKYTNLDTAVILGLLHGDMQDGFFAWDDPRVVSTIQHLIETFAGVYPINKRPGVPGVAIGRYPEDRYAGHNFNGGNPWPLCTLAIAEALYRYSNLLLEQDNIQKAQEVSNRGDQFVERVRYHAQKDGSLNEQIDRYTGYMTSVSDLTWNYAALVTTRHSSLLKTDAHKK